MTQLTDTPQELSAEDIASLVNGYHGDPFSILGPHTYTGGVVVRAFIPAARAIELRIDSKDGPEALQMAKIDPGGFFEQKLPGAELPISYRLRVVDKDGGQSLYEDPYSYPDTLTDYDEYLLAEGTHERLYEQLGAQLLTLEGTAGVRFAVWAPNARRVSVIGDFNHWDGRRHPMRFHVSSGVWDLFIPGLSEGDLYKFEVKTHQGDYTVTKSDPLAFFTEVRPKTASIVWDLDKYSWGDDDWMQNRKEMQRFDRPINIYEVHLGSWRRKDDNRWLNYEELADMLIPYAKKLGYTHIELLPVAEHPYDGSWGYQVTGYYSVTSRYGNPDEFMAFVDRCHQNNLGVILDWVPAHFPRDQHGLAYFDGTFLYEHADPRQSEHPDWGTLIFNYGRSEVRQFLISNALFWMDKYHIDGLRVDAVASMLYLDFSRQPGQWIPNRYGGRENLEAIEFIRSFNERVHARFAGVLTIAEESTSWAGVTRPTDEGGLGFDLKWNMGWMHDTLSYMRNDPIHRAYHHGTLTFSLLYAFSERFVLPLSHDEVVHLKRSMLDKMPGDTWQKFANLRALYAYQIAHPGKKMLFMGGEFAQWREWTEAFSLDWHLLEQFGYHQGMLTFVRELNQLYVNEPALYEDDDSWNGFTWLDLHDAERSILSFARHAPSSGGVVLIACNFTPVVRENYRLGVMEAGKYVEVLNSDHPQFGGSGVLNEGEIETAPISWHGQQNSVVLTLPPLAVTFIKKEEDV